MTTYGLLMTVATKASKLGVKLALVRCVGVEAAACLMAGVAAERERVRVAGPKVVEAAAGVMQALRAAAARQPTYEETKIAAARVP